MYYMKKVQVLDYTCTCICSTCTVHVHTASGAHEKKLRVGLKEIIKNGTDCVS